MAVESDSDRVHRQTVLNCVALPRILAAGLQHLDPNLGKKNTCIVPASVGTMYLRALNFAPLITFIKHSRDQSVQMRIS